MRAKHKTHKRVNPASGLFNQRVQSKRRLYRALVSLHPLLFCLGSVRGLPLCVRSFHLDRSVMRIYKANTRAHARATDIDDLWVTRGEAKHSRKCTASVDCRDGLRHFHRRCNYEVWNLGIAC